VRWALAFALVMPVIILYTIIGALLAFVTVPHEIGDMEALLREAKLYRQQLVRTRAPQKHEDARRCRKGESVDWFERLSVNFIIAQHHPPYSVALRSPQVYYRWGDWETHSWKNRFSTP